MASELLLMSRAEISSTESVIVQPGSGIEMPGRDTPERVLLEDCWEAFVNKKHEDAVRLLPLVERKYIIGTVFDRSLLGFEDEVNFFHFSVTAGWVDIAKDLVTKYNFNPEDCFKIWIYGCTLLCHATAKNHVDVVKYLIGECKCDPMITNEYEKKNVLHIAATNGLPDVLKCAINNHRCNLEATNLSGQTVLLCASGHIDIVKYLIKECNCDPMATDKDGDTILHIAAYRGSLDVIKYAIDHHKCNPQAVNNKGQTVLLCASGHIDIVKYLINECSCDPNATDRDGDTILHIAADIGSLDVLKWAINYYQCNLEVTNNKGQTVLHCAIKHTNVVRFLINECNCDPMTTDKDGDTVLHKAATNGSIDVLKCAINCHQCNLDATNKKHQTVLHCAIQHISHYVKIYCWSVPNIECHLCDINTATEWDETVINCPAGHLAIVEFLINECNADPMTFLHIAAKEKLLAFMKYLIKCHYCDPTADKTILHCAIEHTNVVEFLINECNCDPMATDYYGNTVLHKVATDGSLDVLKCAINHHQCNLEATNKKHQTVLHCAIEHTNVVRFLINECNCDPMATDDNGDTVLHKAARIGSLNVMKWAINRHQCNLEATNKKHETVLHCAIEHTNVVRFLINECNCDPMNTNISGQTPLHLAVSFMCLEAVECLLFTGKCDPVAKDDKGRTPLEMAEGNNIFKIRDLFMKYSNIAISHPVDSYVNILLLGNPGAGKSTLSQVIIDTATGSITLGSFKNVKRVKDCTAGIIPTKLQHKTIGSIILHDFAGHSEYYSSHGAVIENLLQGSGGVFLIVVNILEKEAVKQLHQWLTIVKVEEQKARDQCHVMVVVSHKDEIINPFERKRKKQQIKAITREEGYDAVFLDCRKLGGSSYDSFLNEVSSFCTSFRSTRGRNLSLYCHMMYGLLEKRRKNVWTLSNLMSATKYNKSYVLPNKKEEFLDVLYLLDSTGLISVLKSEDIDEVWVVVNKGILLSELNGKLFAPKTFKEHVDIASNTGIVRVSDLARLFPHYDPDMLICFLKNMELCQELPSFLKVTNLDQLTIEGGETGERLLFFPCLLYSDNRPDVVTKEMYKFGWCLQCIGKYHFFPPRYFHVLSLHLAFKYALPQEDYKLNRRCTFWRNGLYWFNGHGVEVLVEIVDESQCVLVLMSCEEGYSENMVCLRRQVIGEVVNVYKKSCSILDVEELVIDPEKLSYPLKMPRKEIGYGAVKLMLEISNKQDYWVDETGTKQRKLKSILNDESLSDISNISILGGRDIKEMIDAKQLDAKTSIKLDIKNLATVIRELTTQHLTCAVWHDLGLQLGLYEPTLVDIGEKHRGDPVKCFRECLSAWLSGKDNVNKTEEGPSWLSLVSALNIIGERCIAANITTKYCN